MLTFQEIESDTTLTEFPSNNHLKLQDVTLDLALSLPNARFTGVISGTGGLTKRGAGTVHLSGMNTFQGPINIEEGELVLSGVNLGNVRVVNGTLKFVARNTLSTKSSLTIEKDGVVNTQDQELQVASLSGSGKMILGSGRLILNEGSFTGVIQGGRKSSICKITDGRCVLSAGHDISQFMILKGELVGSTQVLMGNISVSSTLIFDQPIDGDFAGQIMGDGVVIKRGEGCLRMSKPSMVAMALRLEAGSLELAQPKAWIGTVEIAESATLVISSAQSLKGLTGSGVIELREGCTLTIPHDSLYTGEIKGIGVVMTDQKKILFDNLPKPKPVIFSGKSSMPSKVEISNTFSCLRPQHINSDQEMVLTRTGVLDLAGHSQTFKHLSGDGVVRLADAKLTLETCDFEGGFEGSGILVVGDEESRYEEGKLVHKKPSIVI